MIVTNPLGHAHSDSPKSKGLYLWCSTVPIVNECHPLQQHHHTAFTLCFSQMMSFQPHCHNNNPSNFHLPSPLKTWLNSHMLCAMFAPTLSLAKNTRPGSTWSLSHRSKAPMKTHWMASQPSQQAILGLNGGDWWGGLWVGEGWGRNWVRHDSFFFYVVFQLI